MGIAPSGKVIITLAGVTTPSSGINGDLQFAGLVLGLPAWSTNGTLTAGSGNVIVQYNGTAWTVTHSSTYSATKTSAATDPVGLTSWTVGTGAGSPTLTAKALVIPTEIQAEYVASTPTAPVAIQA
jgi:hypothetical protein